METTQIRNFKDFLLLYNQISDTCFRRCANTFNSRDISPDEEFCINNCAQKHINANHRVMEVFMEVQPTLVNKRIEEMNAAQALIDAQQEQQKLETVGSNESLQENKDLLVT
ncbi:mitochondrial import inner membrane translocase subunit Tim10 B-like [Cephus cinctus]|uniref:Mitochondrial import inner membrane translocase subunit n=1 Tax=Cephus cinctus TaxID=211228 RepID=A0AAJ7BZF7_CEPCN|nr:mitochondrial import inner membrane translocase subunit Tim10 B-like [Cephus cinctus]